MAEPELLSQIEAKVRHTRRRQGLQLFLSWLPWCLALALLLAGAWAVAEPWLPVFLPPWLPLAIAGGLGFLAAALIAWLQLPSRTSAALALDSAFALNERMTTALSLDATLRTTPAGQALMADARTHLGNLNVASRFPFSLKGRDYLAPLGAGAALAIAIFLPYHPAVTVAAASAPTPEPLVQKLDPLRLQALRQANEERRDRIKNLDDEKLKELQAEFDKLLAQLDKLDKPAEAQLALQEVTRMAEQVQKRQEELAKSFDLKRQMMADKGLKEEKEGPTKDFQKALAQGDLKKAKEEIEKLAQKLGDKKLTDEEKKKLAEGLKDLKEKLKNLAEQKEKLEELAKSSLDPETKQKEMQKILQNMENMKDLAQLAEKMQQAQQAMEKGDTEQAMQDLKELAEQLKEMGIDEKALSELELAESDLEEIREGMG